MHQHGQGVEQDIKLAVEFYQKGCELGMIMSQKLRSFYFHFSACVCLLVKVTPMLTLAWPSVAHMAGEWTFPWRRHSKTTWRPANQVRLVRKPGSFTESKFVTDNPMALYNVATHYFSGLGVPQDLEKAKEYYEKASILGFYPAQVRQRCHAMCVSTSCLVVQPGQHVLRWSGCGQR